MKHAGHGAHAIIRIRYAPGEIHVTAEDDGLGTATLPLPSSGHGLEGIRERVRAFGGEVSSGPRSPHGWTVAARLPLEETP
jgi:signal transduction histidine kinase